MDNGKLKPCPMCGSENAPTPNCESTNVKWLWVECYEPDGGCGLRTKEVSAYFDGEYDSERAEAEAVAAWNRRAEPDSPPKCVYCDDSKRDAEGMRSFDAILVPTHCGQCGRKFDNE